MRVPCASPLGGLSILDSRQCGELKLSPHRRAVCHFSLNVDQPHPQRHSSPCHRTQTTFRRHPFHYPTWLKLGLRLNDLELFTIETTCYPSMSLDNGTKKAKINRPPTVLDSDAQGWTSMASMTHAKSLSTRQTQQPISSHFSSLSPVCGVNPNHA